MESERLRAERLGPDHFEALRRLHADPEAMKTLTTDGKPQGEDFTRAVVTRNARHWEEKGFGVWAWFLKEGGAFVGYCGLRHYLVEGEPETELLYGLLPAFWRQGYGTEMARACLSHAFEDLGLSTVVSFTLHHNKGSRGVMEKNGMAFEKEIVHAGLPHVLYRKRA
jgi:ribosomal-protein-alanine N-acetyltransferase